MDTQICTVSFEKIKKIVRGPLVKTNEMVMMWADMIRAGNTNPIVFERMMDDVAKRGINQDDIQEAYEAVKAG